MYCDTSGGRGKHEGLPEVSILENYVHNEILAGCGARIRREDARGIARAGANRQWRVFRETRIGLRQLAKEEAGAFSGFDGTGVKAVRAKAERGRSLRNWIRQGHE